MKRFFEKYSYESVRLFLNQFAISLFGLTLGIASYAMKNKPLLIITSVASIIFYLFLQYTVAWNTGATDKISIDCNHAKKDMMIPIYMWLLSNVLNFVIAICFTLGFFLKDISFFGNMQGIATIASFLLEGEYFGLLSLQITETFKLLDFPFVYFVITLPSLAIALFGYAMGLKGQGHLNFLGQSYPDSDSPEKKKGWFNKK